MVFIEARSYNGPFSATPNLLVIHSVESEIRAGLARSLAINWFGNAGSASTSAHKMFGPDEGVEMVPSSHVAYHCGGGNRGSHGNEHLGRAAFSREQWLANGGDVQLRMAARDAWLDGQALGRPWRWLSVAQVAQAFANPGRMDLGGLCTHNDMRLAVGGTTHTDPGPNFPYDLFLAWGPPGEEDDMFSDADRERLIHIGYALGTFTADPEQMRDARLEGKVNDLRNTMIRANLVTNTGQPNGGFPEGDPMVLGTAGKSVRDIVDARVAPVEEKLDQILELLQAATAESSG